MAALVEYRSFLDDILVRQSARRKAIDPIYAFPPQPIPYHAPSIPSKTSADVTAAKENVVNYVAEEETVRNDYTEWYGVSGRSGADYILGAKDDEICEEYPALKRLMKLKAEAVNTASHPPLYLPLQSSDPTNIMQNIGPTRFDVILVHPHGTWDDIAALPIRNISADPGFVFLWVGAGDQEGLDKGRECLAKWGFRRAEDIVGVKTTPTSSDLPGTSGASGRVRGVGGGGLLASQKEHCLMGIRGTVRRSTDTHFVHCNVDTDVMLWCGADGADGPQYPPYLYNLIESFCLGTRRLQLFAPPKFSRRGWVTASLEPSPSNSGEEVLQYDSSTYPTLLPEKQDGRDVMPYNPEIDNLRPKSPVKGQRRPQGQASQQGANRGSMGFRGGRGRGGPSSFGQPRFQQQQQQQQPGFGYPMQMGNPMGYIGMPMMGMGMDMNGMSIPGVGMGMPGMDMGMGTQFNGYPMGMGQMSMDPQMAYMMAQAQFHNQQQPQFPNSNQMYQFQQGQQQMWDNHGSSNQMYNMQGGANGYEGWQGGNQQWQ